MESIFTLVLNIALGIHILLMAIVAIRLWRADHTINRLIASDILSNLALAVLVLTAMIHHQYIFLYVALGLAALGFISVIAFAKYMADKKIF